SLICTELSNMKLEVSPQSLGAVDIAQQNQSCSVIVHPEYLRIFVGCNELVSLYLPQLACVWTVPRKPGCVVLVGKAKHCSLRVTPNNRVAVIFDTPTTCDFQTLLGVIQSTSKQRRSLGSLSTDNSKKYPSSPPILPDTPSLLVKSLSLLTLETSFRQCQSTSQKYIQELELSDTSTTGYLDMSTKVQMKKELQNTLKDYNNRKKISNSSEIDIESLPNSSSENLNCSNNRDSVFNEPFTTDLLNIIEKEDTYINQLKDLMQICDLPNLVAKSIKKIYIFHRDTLKRLFQEVHTIHELGEVFVKNREEFHVYGDFMWVHDYVIELHSESALKYTQELMIPVMQIRMYQTLISQLSESLSSVNLEGASFHLRQCIIPSKISDGSIILNTIDNLPLPSNFCGKLLMQGKLKVRNNSLMSLKEEYFMLLTESLLIFVNYKEVPLVCHRSMRIDMIKMQPHNSDLELICEFRNQFYIFTTRSKYDSSKWMAAFNRSFEYNKVNKKSQLKE
ncbi:unnamed protein product, partial [Meganyctiphanes norvegica]